ncbi:helix-turn-helix domain-containing protein [Spirosoma foliorum]|uniref:AraC family transcriptional regulator n=1 Tax=Spirosoma foliorum TaxID=2710596 RepID=A0A7G5GVB0_9BACT|nr:helix-turn-helix domain-containing protein [Spirosoma foliorum]QMW02802.1 AraC family transcriptional regulator [Spirosoma foliorum]
MAVSETIEEFYEQRALKTLDVAGENTGQFHVFKKDNMAQDKQPPRFARRNFYKITLIRGHHLFHYADKTLEVSGDTLIFSNPAIPYTFEPISEESGGYFCIFRESFLSQFLRASLRELPMYQIGGSPAYSLDKTMSSEIGIIFEKMVREHASDFRFRYDLIRNYTLEIIYTALKLQPSDKLYPHSNANTRLTAVFMELLERQFPVESLAQPFSMKSAKDFANRLAIHVNHLNRAVKMTTGRTTSELIYDRIIVEAKALLKHTDWNVSEIGFSLGFDEPSHFNHFFKRHTNHTPLEYRN